MVEVVLLFGSNDAQAADIVNRAVEVVSLTVGEIERLSGEYVSEAYGFTSEREFVNRAAVITTSCDAYEVLRRINLIEALLGRDRDKERRISAQRNEMYASRPIDIDIIFYGDKTFDDQRLTIPYHFLYEREYALRPVAEVAGKWRHAALTLTPSEALAILERRATVISR